MKIIGITGLMGSGKGTVADYLIDDHGFKKMSFADALKDAVAVMFGWPRHMLEGDTDESRAWREQVDEFWSERLERPGFTPRLALQLMGTEAGRQVFGNDIWVAGIEQRILGEKEYYDTWHREQSQGMPDTPPRGIVIPDVRFFNEIQMIKRLGGTMVRVERGDRPEYWDAAGFLNCVHNDLAQKDPESSEEEDKLFDEHYDKALEMVKDIHASEREWIMVDQPDHVIFNNFDLERLKWSADQLAEMD